MARKSKQQPAKVRPTAESIQAAASRPQPVATPQRTARSILLSATTSKAVGLVILAAIYAPLSQLILAPVYGSIPSGLYHKYGLIGASLLAFALRGILPRWTERGLPAFAFWIPSIQLLLSSVSSQLGNPRGPLVTEVLTVFPLITWSLYIASKIFEDVDLSFLNNDSMEEAAPSMIFYMLFSVVQRLFKDVLPQLTSFGFLTTRIGLQLFIGVFYGLLLPNSLFWPAVPSIAITMTVNVHNTLQRTTSVLNNTLALHQYSLLERRESASGYVSVLEDRTKGFRVMRCDHSLLGGQWLDGGPKNSERKVAEPIYAVFTMMEAVRLVEPPKSSKSVSAEEKRALNIGLGIGTAPSALIHHGVNTTILELDPVVYYYARKYFGLPYNHQFIIADAADFIPYEASQNIPEAMKYDYILHDVFTGGAVPTSLFTHEFLVSLSKLLKQDGTIAINYAGDLNLPSASLIHHTVKSVFPNCRVFREEPEAEAHPDTAGAVQDFTNLVYYCTHPSNAQPITFRKPTKADFLGSGARQEFLYPKHELDAVQKFAGKNSQVVTLRSPALKELEKWQTQSALGHWRLMRRVIPDVVWENW